jgi:hypothetical protein
LVGALAHPGHGVRAIVEARARQPVLIQDGDRFVQLAATLFEVGTWAAQLGDEALEHRRDGGARPRIRHRDPKTVDMRQREGTGAVLMVMGILGQDGQHLACAQVKTEGEHPDEAVRKGRLA